MAASSSGSPVARCPQDLALQISQRAYGVEFDLKVEDVFVRAAPNRQHPMRRNLGRRLAVIEIHLELAIRVFRAFHSVTDHDAVGQHHLAKVASELRGFANLFRDDVPGAFNGIFDGSDALLAAYELFRIAEKREFRPFLVPKVIRQGFQPLLASNGGLRSTFGTVWKVEVLKDALLQLCSRFAPSVRRLTCPVRQYCSEQ